MNDLLAFRRINIRKIYHVYTCYDNTWPSSNSDRDFYKMQTILNILKSVEVNRNTRTMWPLEEYQLLWKYIMSGPSYCNFDTSGAGWTRYLWKFVFIYEQKTPESVLTRLALWPFFLLGPIILFWIWTSSFFASSSPSDDDETATT